MAAVVARAWRRASATPMAGHVPSVGRVCLPSRVRMRIDQVATPAAVRRSTSPRTLASRSSVRPVTGGFRARNMASLISRTRHLHRISGSVPPGISVVDVAHSPFHRVSGYVPPGNVLVPGNPVVPGGGNPVVPGGTPGAQKSRGAGRSRDTPGDRQRRYTLENKGSRKN
jgi:hypothetical protein